jgi:hypothetical protein
MYNHVVKRLIDTSVIEQVNVPLGRGCPLVLYQMKSTKPSIKHEYYVQWIMKQLSDEGYVLRTNRLGPDITIPSHQTRARL